MCAVVWRGVAVRVRVRGSAWPVFMVLSQHPQWPQTQRPVSCEALWPVARCPSKKSV
eukprot:COSAG01_NODE_58483_length_305_cov_7.747573_1_plen_56_part_10